MARWIGDVEEALRNLGGAADLPDIYAGQAHASDRAAPGVDRRSIRRELEQHSSDSESYLREEDLFRSMDRIGGGR